MPKPKTCVLRAPGTNCDLETAFAFERAGSEADRVHLFRLLDRPSLLRDYQILCIPGGFSYGDDVGAGVVFGSQLRVHLADAVAEFLQSDSLVLGICNGFQVLLKSGILPGPWTAQTQADRKEPHATLTWNDNGRYTARWTDLRVHSAQSVFLQGIERIELPIAHAEGRLVVRDEGVIEGWRRAGQLALQYAEPETVPASGAKGCTRAPANPNGSAADIAGLCDETGRVLGLMPHPERFIDATQHPQWTRRHLRGEGDGMRIFRNAVGYFS